MRLDEISRVTADALSAARPDPSRVRAVLAGFFKHGARAGFTTGELVDFLGVSSPSILEQAGFSDDEATLAMDVVVALTDEEIAAADTWSST